MKVAAIVNGNARAVRGRLRARLESALPGRLHITGDLDDARVAIRAAIRQGADLIVLGGGDGTVVMGLTLIAEACRGAGCPEPAIGVLRLGSGNAIADAVGARDDLVGELARLVRGEGTRRMLPLLEVLGVRAPFVGVGVDAQLLEDQESVGKMVDRVPLARRMLGGASRYALSVALRSVPRFLGNKRPHVVVTNTGAPAIEMGRNGPTGRTIPTGAVLWEGACTLAAGATIPFFGFGMRMFTFADTRPDRFQLRCGSPGLAEMVREAPAVFRGEYFSDQVADFLCDAVRFELDVDVPVEAGGELLGPHRHLDLALGAPAQVIALG